MEFMPSENAKETPYFIHVFAYSNILKDFTEVESGALKFYTAVWCLIHIQIHSYSEHTVGNGKQRECVSADIVSTMYISISAVRYITKIGRGKRGFGSG